MKLRHLLSAALVSAGFGAFAQVMTPAEQLLLYSKARMFEAIVAKCDAELPMPSGTRAETLQEFRNRHARVLDAVAKRIREPGFPLSEERMRADVARMMQQNFPSSGVADFCNKIEADFRRLAGKSESEIAIDNFREELRRVELRQRMMCSDVEERLRVDAAKMIEHDLFRWDEKQEDVEIKFMLKGSLEEIVVAARACALVQRIASQRTIPMKGDFATAFDVARQLHQSVDFVNLLKSTDRDADLRKGREAATRYLAATAR